MIPFNKNISKIKTYEPGKSGKIKTKFKNVKLSSNESPIKFSKITLDKINNILLPLSKYPDPKCNQLREKISKLYNIKKNNIIFGNGSDEIFFFNFILFFEQKFRRPL